MDWDSYLQQLLRIAIAWRRAQLATTGYQERVWIENHLYTIERTVNGTVVIYESPPTLAAQST